MLRPWLEENAADIELVYIPSDSPDLNPDEILNHDLKANAVGRKRAKNREELVANAVEHLESRARTPERVAAYFQERHVRYAA